MISFRQFIPYIVLLGLIFGLRIYNDWRFNNEPVTGIGISYEELVEKSKLVVTKAHDNTPRI